MSHPIIEGTVKILKIVTPGAYWIKCNACEGSSRVPTSIKHKPQPNEYYYPQQGEKVFVRDEDGFFYRGSVCGRRVLPEADFWKYVVQLTDTFQVKDFDQDNVYPSYGESSAACGSAHLVSLYHVLPRIPPAAYGKCVKAESVERQAFEKAVVNWSRSVASMAHLTEGAVKFSFLQCKLINGSVYGDISTSPPLRSQTGMVCQDLSDYLHFEKLAVRMTFRFEHVVKSLMANHLINFNELLDTFDPYGKATIKPKPAPSLEKPPEPIESDFNGFNVHPDDVALHQSLVQQYHINVIYTGPPLKHETIVRYVNPDGHVVLGTVVNVDLKYAEDINTPYCSYRNGFCVKKYCPTIITNSEYLDMYYPDEKFEDLPPESDEPGNPLLSYNFDESLRNFQAAGGVFREQYLPYPYSSTVEELIVQHFDLLGVDNFHDWQKLCLPSFCCRKNLLVIGCKSKGKLTMAIISALAWMSFVKDFKSDSIHPQLVIFFRDFERADRAASFCVQLTDFRVIMSTSSFISEKQKAMAKNGCDVLITTPSNWNQLVSQKVFDSSRLNHVIFDELDRLHETYSEDLVSIFEDLGRYKSRRVQTVIVANSWGALIGDERIQGKVEFPTVCIMGIILACCFYRLTPTAVFIKRDDCFKRLGDIISMTSARKPPTKTLLLCKDEEEGRTIIEKIPSNQRVRFAHDSLCKEDALKVVKEWDRWGDELLVCTDDCIGQLDFLKNVDVLISWMTSSWDTLSSRFMVFNHSLGTAKGLSWASAYLFCDCEKLDELLLMKNITNNLNFINGSLDEHLSRASILAEISKLTNICPFFFMFGKCGDFPTCPHRHVFLPDDDVEVLGDRQFLNVDILRVHSAFKYSVRVREVVSNYGPKASKNLYTLISNLEEIENGLVKSCRKLCSPNLLRVGQIVGGCISRGGDTVLRRVTVKSIPENGSGLYSVSMLDFEEPDVCLPLSQLFILPEEVAAYPKDYIDLYVTGLEPSDFRSDWQNDTYNYVTAGLNHTIRESNFLAGKVEMTCFANRSVLVDSLYCFRDSGPFQKSMVSIIDSEFCSLKDFILESGYCVRNEGHLSSLSNALGSTTSDGSATPPLSLRLPLDVEARHGRRADLPSHPVPAVVSSYDDPGLLYVQLLEDSQKLAAFENVCTSTLERSKQKLPLIAIDELCAVYHKGAWNRAVIKDITSNLENPLGSICVLFIDYGDTLLDAHPHQLYSLPDDLASIPSFAIKCELVGIVPLGGGEWHAKAIDEFHSYVRTSVDEMEELTVEFHGTKETDQSSSYYPKYLVTLSGPQDSDFSINYHLVRRGLARFDPETKHLLKTPIINGRVGKYSKPRKLPV